jgi:hypothetical protein
MGIGYAGGWRQFDCGLDQSQGHLVRSRYVRAMFEVMVIKRRPTKWVWQVRDREGKVLMHGWETTRRLARYRGDRALFLLLAAPART